MTILPPAPVVNLGTAPTEPAPAKWPAATAAAQLLRAAADFTADDMFPEEAMRLASSAFAGGGATEERFRATLARVCGWRVDFIDEAVEEVRAEAAGKARAAAAELSFRVVPMPHDCQEPGQFARGGR